MIHFTDCMFYESVDDTEAEFVEIFKTLMYSWNGRFGSSIDSRYGVCDDPLNPTWGVFGKLVTDYPHSQLRGRRVFVLQLVHGDVDLETIFTELLGRFDFIITNEYCLALDGSVDLDGFNRCLKIPGTGSLSIPSIFD